MPRRSKSIDTDALYYWLEYGVDIDNRRIMVDDDIDNVSTGLAVRAVFSMLSQNKDKPINLYINTYGGSVYDNMSLYDALIASPCEIHTYATGKVMSAGTWLQLAGDKRFAYSNATFMCHSIAGGVDGDNKLFNQKTDINECDRIYKKLLDIYDERTTKTKHWWQRWIKHEDRYFDVEKAIELGFVNQPIIEFNS